MKEFDHIMRNINAMLGGNFVGVDPGAPEGDSTVVALSAPRNGNEYKIFLLMLHQLLTAIKPAAIKIAKVDSKNPRIKQWCDALNKANDEIDGLTSGEVKVLLMGALLHKLDALLADGVADDFNCQCKLCTEPLF